MRKLISCLTLLAMLSAMAACGNEKPNTNTLTTETAVVLTDVPETETETESASALDVNIRDITGIWYEESLNPRILAIHEDGTYTLDNKSGGTAYGTVKVETEEHPDGTSSIWYSFYEEDGTLWTGFQKSDVQPQTELWAGQDGALHFFRETSETPTTEPVAVTTAAPALTVPAATAAPTATTAKPAAATSPAATTAAPKPTAAATTAPNESKPNAYGFYQETNIQQTGISIKALEDVWYSVDNLSESIEFYDCDMLSGRFIKQNTDASLTEGYVQLEYDSARNHWYNLYQKNGTLLLSFRVTGEIPLDDLYAGQTGSPHYTRENSNAPVVPRTTGDDFLGVWGCGRCTISISEEGAGYNVSIKWASSAAEGFIWEYHCSFDPGDEMLHSDNYATKTHYYFTDDGIESSELVYANGCGAFCINGSGNLNWLDFTEDEGSGIEFIS